MLIGVCSAGGHGLAHALIGLGHSGWEKCRMEVEEYLGGSEVRRDFVE